MTPGQINQEHGKDVWLCYGCKTNKNLYWWNGLSVAVCGKQCGDKYAQFISREMEAERAYQEYCNEYLGRE